jgi:hypothetical protein
MKKNNIIRNSALALSLMAGAALLAATLGTAEAKSIQRDGYFGGTYAPIGPKNDRYVQRHRGSRHYDRRYYDRGYYGPRYTYRAPYRYGRYAPYYYDRGPASASPSAKPDEGTLSRFGGGFCAFGRKRQ